MVGASNRKLNLFEWRICMGSRSSKWLEEVWKGLPGQISIVCCSFLNELKGDPSTGLGEVRALTYMTSVLYTFYPPERINIFYAKPHGSALTMEGLGENIIVIGGPLTNALSRELLSRKDFSVRFTFDNQYCLLDSKRERIIGRARYVDENQPYSIVADYGYIVHRTIDVCGKRRRVWMFMGCHTFGSYAAAVMALTDEFCAALVRSKQRDCYDVVVRIESEQSKVPISEGDEVLIRTEGMGDVPPVGPVKNRVDVDSALRALTFGSRFQQENVRKKYAYVLLGAVAFILIFPYLVKMIFLLLR